MVEDSIWCRTGCLFSSCRVLTQVSNRVLVFQFLKVDNPVSVLDKYVRKITESLDVAQSWSGFRQGRIANGSPSKMYQTRIAKDFCTPGLAPSRHQHAVAA